MKNPANKIAESKRATEATNTCPLSGMLAHKLILKQLYVMCYYARSYFKDKKKSRRLLLTFHRYSDLIIVIAKIGL